MGAVSQQTPEQRARALATAPSAVSVHELSKSFVVPHQRYSTLKERALHPFAARSYDTLRALDSVTFDVKRGEFFGIVGRNGSGKSTLLKCLAGIYNIGSGRIDITGRLSPFIELGVGFNPDLTARDNVLINGIMLGLSRKEARRRFDDIIAFAELEDFVDLKLKNYSSGMGVRLGFSVAIEVNADVLLIDEVLAVGDAAFQRKCFDEFERMREEQQTILFVTHDMNTVERFCDRAMLLENGRVLDIGPPSEIAQRYNEINFGWTPGEEPGPTDGHGLEARITRLWVEEEAGGEPVLAVSAGDSQQMRMEVEFFQRVDNPVFFVTFRNDVGHTIFVATSLSLGLTGRFESGERVKVRFSFENWLAPSRYSLTPSVGVWDPDFRVLDEKRDLTSLIVDRAWASGGVTELPTEVEVERQ
jgi:ABC-type polysaccharide/polyol phosphate transport system ATPase subunit